MLDAWLRDADPAPVSVYAVIRDVPNAFLVAAGHHDPAHETVVSDQGEYLIVTAVQADDGMPVAAAPDEPRWPPRRGGLS